MKRPATLSATFVSKIRTAGTFGDGRGGHGLAIRIKPTVSGRISKNWVQRLRLRGGPTINAGLGSFPIVSLAQARQKALENARAAYRGEDPRRSASKVPTFRTAAERVIRLRTQSWKSGSRLPAQWRSSIANYVDPIFGEKPVDEVSSADVLRCLQPIWSKKPATARRLLGRLSVVCRWAVASGLRAGDPTAGVAEALPKQNGMTKHHRALGHEAVGDAIHQVRASDATPAVKLAFEFLVLMAARWSEIRFAEWTEIDRENGVWTVPAGRSKTGREHRVPLSRRALEILEEARKLGGGGSPLVFERGDGPLGDKAVRDTLRRLGVAGAPHGFRSSFRDWAAEETDYPREIAEAALAHAVKGVEGAYMRSDLFERRRRLMDDWAAYVAS